MIARAPFVHKLFFTSNLLKWNSLDNVREMPWKNEKDPYRIWVSEIILQQTRVIQGLGYYNRFIKQLPTLSSLAEAEDTLVFKLWEGLGYYSRCKNLLKSARFIINELGGNFPGNYDDILALSGVGPYTASAIASFAFNLPYAVLDGNVFRVLSRFFGIDIPIDGRENGLYKVLAQELLNKQKPGTYNQAIMDFGAVICKPQLPLCEGCPLNPVCVAFNKGLTGKLPVKVKKILRTTRWFNYLVIEYNNQFYTRKREAKDIWQNLHEFVLIEANDDFTPEELENSEQYKAIFGRVKPQKIKVSQLKKQQLTHQTIITRLITIRVYTRLNLEKYELFSREKIRTLAFPKIIASYLRE